MNQEEYLCDENWLGSFYELSLELGPCGDDVLAKRALETLWGLPQLRGAWRERAHFSSGRDGTDLPLGNVRLYGVLALEDGTELGCMSHLGRIEGESDWLDLSTPVSMLELQFPVRYPLDRTVEPWLAKLDRLLIQVAAGVCEHVPFRLGIIGEEAGGMRTAEELTVADCERGGFLLVPEPLWRRLGPKRVPDLILNGVVYVSFRGPDITYGG